MNIHPRPDQELAIQEAIRAGFIKSELDILDIGLENLLKQNKKESPDEVITRLASFGKRHNLSIGDSTIKELINDGRL
ncbi:MAG: hypothetical protein ABSB19_03600 [Methylomonas sp.]|jgi:hypothetical protein